MKKTVFIVTTIEFGQERCVKAFASLPAAKKHFGVEVEKVRPKYKASRSYIEETERLYRYAEPYEGEISVSIHQSTLTF